MDIIAAKLAIDPVELRKRNIVREGEENLRGEITHSIGAEECLDKVARCIEWGKPSEESTNNVMKGKGLALANKYTLVDTVSSAAVRVHKDGLIEVRHGTDEIGQGINTVLAQIAAEEFKVPMKNVKVVWGDTDTSPFDYGAVSSRSTLYTGKAVQLACQDAKHQIFELAAPILGAAPQDLETRDGKVYVRKSPETAIPISDLFLPATLPEAKGAQKAASCLAEDGELIGKATFFFKDATDEDPETGQGKKLTASYGYAAQAVEVAVDTETGEVRILKFVNAFDMGQPINPKMCEGQMEGGAAMGIGSALYEELVVDKGAVLNPNFKDYRIPSTMQIPTGENMKSMIVSSTPHKDGPFWR